jgi:RNA polymerase sigma factor (sigma-70 family)
MNPPDEKTMLSGIRNHDSLILEYIYQTYFPMIEGYIIHHQGSYEQAQDVFQEALMIILHKVRENKLELSCKFGTYLYAICKKIWVQERKKYLLHIDKLKQYPLTVHDPGPEEDPLFKELKVRIFNRHFMALSPDCQRILRMFFKGFTIEEIRAEMNYNDLHHTADRKYRCKKSLIKRILEDPLFKRLIDEQR